MKKEEYVVTYQELSKYFSHFEIAFLGFYKAIELIRTGVYLNSFSYNKQLKPKVATVALKMLLEDPEAAKSFAQEVIQSLLVEETSEEFDDYNVDAGHLSLNDAE